MRTEKERMKAALWSLYFKRRGGRRSMLPPELRPIPAEHALDVLIAHPDRHGGARTRRGLLEAGAADLHKPNTTRHAVTQNVHGLAGKLGVPPSILDGVGTADAPDAARALLANASTRGINAAIKTNDIVVTYDPRTNDTTMEVVTVVNRPINQMEKAMDPRNWRRCSDFFERSDPVDPDTLRPRPDPQHGERWQMFEVFSNPSATFENLLNIEFDVQLAIRRPYIRVSYSLYESLSFRWFGLSLPGVHERNSGTIEAIPDTDAGCTLVRTTKTIRYRDLTPDDPRQGGIDQGLWLNYCAPAMLGLWIDESSQGRVACEHL
ncbi:MAG TPA: hypothetical protein VKA21_08445 [Candidatus Binatia bacterium]|nr:hypothetical protein [Candidatus Binatia bacterium]